MRRSLLGVMYVHVACCFPTAHMHTRKGKNKSHQTHGRTACRLGGERSNAETRRTYMQNHGVVHLHARASKHLLARRGVLKQHHGRSACFVATDRRHNQLLLASNLHNRRANVQSAHAMLLYRTECVANRMPRDMQQKTQTFGATKPRASDLEPHTLSRMCLYGCATIRSSMPGVSALQRASPRLAATHRQVQARAAQAPVSFGAGHPRLLTPRFDLRAALFYCVWRAPNGGAHVAHLTVLVLIRIVLRLAPVAHAAVHLVYVQVGRRGGPRQAQGLAGLDAVQRRGNLRVATETQKTSCSKKHKHGPCAATGVVR